MNEVNKTLYIPLYGKAFVSKKGFILKDKKAEEIWLSVGFNLKGKAKSKWLAYFMAMRSWVFDEWVRQKVKKFPDAIVLHLGCGLDGRITRISAKDTHWFDVDFPAVIDERKRFYSETEFYKMVSADVKDCKFINALPKTERAIVILEGVSMYLTNQELKNLLKALGEKYSKLSVLVDCYTPFAVKISKFKNPVKTVGVNKVYGVKCPYELESENGLTFIKEHSLTPKNLIGQLQGIERLVFSCVYAGKISKRLYKLYEYENPS